MELVLLHTVTDLNLNHNVPTNNPRLEFKRTKLCGVYKFCYLPNVRIQVGFIQDWKTNLKVHPSNLFLNVYYNYLWGKMARKYEFI